MDTFLITAVTTHNGKGPYQKGQFLKIRCICNRIEDYRLQTDILIDRFVNKGYKREEVENTRNQVELIDREHMLKDRIGKSRDQNEVPFITGFNIDYNILESIIKKTGQLYVGIQIQEKSYLPNQNSSTGKQEESIRDGICKNVPDPPKKI